MLRDFQKLSNSCKTGPSESDFFPMPRHCTTPVNYPLVRACYFRSRQRRITMTEIVDTDIPPAPAKRVGLLAIAVLVAAGLGFGASYTGTFAPSSLFSQNRAVTFDAPRYADVPRITVPLGASRALALGIKLEIAAESQGNIDNAMPRILDSFNRFLTNIEAAAFSRRGVLEIIRQELLTRAQHIAGESAVTDLLVTEFAIQ
ncbi:MAG: flagellar basal body-associated FliL family protein [Paracoccus sp. (in: a-proteobacteria)]|nr:flagellar basal body-associated FliL family protein [Paracoccus sp. (in: a-proteobacteria)]